MNASGSSRVGSFVRTAGFVPEAWIFPKTHGNGNTWAMSTEAPGSSLDYLWQFIDNAEPNANSFSLIIFNDSGSNRDFDYVVYQKAM